MKQGEGIPPALAYLFATRGLPAMSNDNNIGYLKMRLDHTITHLKEASKLIYLVDGAVLAFVYFLVDRFTLTRDLAFFLAAISIVLAGVNFLHSRFIVTQQHWYRQIDDRLRQVLGEAYLEPVPEGKLAKQLFTSSHRNLKHVYVWIVVWLLIIAFFLLLYGFGLFNEIQIGNPPAGNGTWRLPS